MARLGKLSKGNDIIYPLTVADGVVFPDSQETLPEVLEGVASGKADKSATVSSVDYNTTSKKITKTINGTTSDVVTAATIVQDGGGATITFRQW